MWSWIFPVGKVRAFEFLQGLTDIHCHLLPGVDDGSHTEEESFLLLERLEKVDIRRIVFTPHVMADLPANHASFLRERFLDFKQLYRGKVELALGAEYMLDEKFRGHLTGGLLCYADRHVLVETSYLSAPLDFQSLLYEIMMKGYMPVLAHPERYSYMSEKDHAALKDKGYKFQLNLLSLSGYYGKAPRLCSERLLKKGMYDFAGSDIHNERQVKMLEGVIMKRGWEKELKRLKENNEMLWKKG